MNQDDKLFVFAEDDVNQEPEPLLAPWHVLVVDDDAEVHSVTRLALANFRFAKRRLEIHSAYSASEAREILSSGEEFVMALVDVVMETDQAGLELVKWIREEHHDQRIRLILRTGQAGNMPQRTIIENYNINDYKEKTDLTANKLFAMLYSSLRSYRDISALEHKREGLESIVRASNEIFLPQSMEAFASAVLAQLAKLAAAAHLEGDPCSDCFAAIETATSTKVLAATGKFDCARAQALDAALAVAKITTNDFNTSIQTTGYRFSSAYFVGVHGSRTYGREVRADCGQAKLLVYCEGAVELDALGQELVEMFGGNVSIAFANQLSHSDWH